MAYLKDKIITREMRHKRKTDEDLLDYANRKRRMGRFNDVDIKVENVIFPVNKMILSSNSEYFERMFESEMQESYQNEVTIKGVTSSSMKSLVEYFYTNQIDINKDNVFELLSASNMLQIDDVSGACLKFLQVSINFDTVFTILSLADLYLSKELQDGAKFFILQNLDDIIMSEKFQQLKLTELHSILEVKKINQDSLYKAYVEWTKYDLVNRSAHFPDLFAKINLTLVSNKLLDDVISNEKLVIENCQCSKILRKEMTRCVRKKDGPTSLLVVGGESMYEKVFEIFNVSQAPKKTYPNMIVGSSCCGAVFLQGLLYTVGGTTGEEISTTTNLVSCLNLKKDDLEWKDVAPMKKKRFGHGTAILNDKIYVTGGVDENGLYLRCGECYNPTSNAWTKISAMKLARCTHALAACKGHVYAIGGRSKDDNGSRLVSVERYDPESDSWDEIAPMKFFRSWLAAVPMDDNYIYALGGESRDDKIEKSVERYDVITGEWNNVSAMQESRHCHAASVVQGKIYTVGGACQSGVILCSLECYDPTTDEWSMIDDELDENFINHALVAV